MAQFSRFVHVSLRKYSPSERQFEAYVERFVDALERKGYTDIHVGASLRQKTLDFAMEIEAPTEAAAQKDFARIVESASAYARPAFAEPDSESGIIGLSGPLHLPEPGQHTA